MVALAIFAVSLLTFAGWFSRRWWLRVPSTALGSASPRASPSAPVDTTSVLAGTPIDALRLETANDLMAERLWRLAYSAPGHAPPLESVHAQIRVAIVAKLQPKTLNPAYFPRRPALLPQLMRAVSDPDAAADKLSRMIAHDPVLTADVLRIANSSLYRNSTTPIESIQRAIVVCGVESLRGILAIAMLRPVFRATRTNFPRLPRM